MQSNTTLRWVLAGVFATGFAWTSMSFASGTLSPGGSNDNVAQGRKAYLSKLTCTECPVAGGVTDKAGATQLIERLKKDEFSLSAKERNAVIQYLTRRWRLR